MVKTDENRFRVGALKYKEKVLRKFDKEIDEYIEEFTQGRGVVSKNDMAYAVQHVFLYHAARVLDSVK